MLTLSLLLACGPTDCTDIKGAVCVDSSSPLDTNNGWAWFDQLGRQVTDGPDLVWRDRDGVIWRVDAVQAKPYAAEGSPDLARVWFEGEDCAGAGWRRGLPDPMTAVTTTPGLWVWTGSYTPVEIESLSSADAKGSCVVEAVEGLAIPVGELLAIEEPGVTWVPPLVPEDL